MRGLPDLLQSASLRAPAPVRRWLYKRRSAASKVALSRNFGWERGTPVDRLYIESFLKANASLIKGRVLEIGDATYSRRFGGNAIKHQDVLHVDPDAPGATIVGDICDPQVLPDNAFDCIIFTQTLHLIYDMREALRQLHRALAPGGVLLLTVPGITPVDSMEWNDCWYWSLNLASVRRLVTDIFGSEEFGLAVKGNLYAATALLHGAVLEDIDTSAMEPADPVYPVIICAMPAKAAVGEADPA